MEDIGNGGGKERGNDDSAEAPFPESAVDFLRSCARKAPFQERFSLPAGQLVSNVAAEDRTQRGHERVVGPPGLLGGREEDRQEILATRSGDRRVINQAQQDQPRPARAAAPGD